MATDYGLDTYCFETLSTGRFASGVMLVAQNQYHRLITPRNQLRGAEDEENFGIDITQEIGRIGSASGADELRGKILGELGKDERIDTLDVSVVPAVEGPAVTYTIDIVGETGEGPFELVLAASAVTVELLKITAGEVA